MCSGAFPAESLVEQDVFRRGGDVLAAAHHVRDAHQVVIHHVGEVIGREAVALEQDLVVELFVLHGDVAVDEILEGSRTFLAYALADHVRQALGQLRLHLFGGQPAAAPVVTQDGSIMLFFRLLGLLRLLAETAVGVAFGQQLLGVFLVEAAALALRIRPHRPAFIRALVVLQAGHGESFVDDLHTVLHEPGLVGILYAQDENAFVLARVQVRVQGGAEVADMHVAGRAGSESGSDFHDVSPLFVISRIRPGVRGRA